MALSSIGAVVHNKSMESCFTILLTSKCDNSLNDNVLY